MNTESDNKNEYEDIIKNFIELLPLFKPVILKLIKYGKLKEATSLTKLQLQVLGGIALNKSTSMTQIAEMNCISKEQASRCIAKLVELGLVERIPDVNNRRFVHATLSKKGHELVVKLKAHLVKDLAGISTALTREDFFALADATDTLKILFKKIGS